MDATIADIYLVSRFNRKDVVGRPNVYLAVDTATQLIVGFYVGFNSGFSAVSACLYNAMENKVENCHRYGLDRSMAVAQCRYARRNHYRFWQRIHGRNDE